ncbi:SMC5-SMC6 complex kleisin component Non-SMC element 1 [Xylocopa sonorina]|uniref:SMC5-SMC6 complex kleisin component Non-SMC element 1 n=1 Tax=Xylocopa sonorina TaxID=1818115 RepID=UPI00403A821B
MPKKNSESNETSSILRSPQERKETLRKIITKAEYLRNAVSDTTVQQLESYIQETDTINSEISLDEKISNQEVVLLDSEMMNVSSNVLKYYTRSFKKLVCSYDQTEFAQKLLQHLKPLPDAGSESPDWSLLETDVIKSFKTTASYRTLLGTLAPLEKKEIKRKKSTVREPQAQIKRPENIVAIEEKEEGVEHTVRMNKFISRYYKVNKKPLDFFKFILHPNDFGKTIENILQISFLVRDGKVKIMKDAFGILSIQPRPKATTSQTIIEDNPNIPNVININMEQWKILKDIYRLKKPMIECD